MVTFMILCLVIAIGALFINSLVQVLGDRTTDLDDINTAKLNESAQDQDKVLSIYNSNEIKATDADTNITIQEAA
jgi:hypothetical protein